MKNTCELCSAQCDEEDTVICDECIEESDSILESINDDNKSLGPSLGSGDQTMDETDDVGSKKCEHCGALEQVPHTDECPLYDPTMNMYEDDEVEHKLGLEGVFDKYMDQIVIKESSQRVFDAKSDTPQRVLIKRHRERPINRTRIGVKK